MNDAQKVAVALGAAVYWKKLNRKVFGAEVLVSVGDRLFYYDQRWRLADIGLAEWRRRTRFKVRYIAKLRPPKGYPPYVAA